MSHSLNARHNAIGHNSTSHSTQLDQYLPQKIRQQIEQCYYAKVNEQASLDYVARNDEFLANPMRHVALFSDHGVVHVRDVAHTILTVLDSINGVLIPKRNPLWLNFMKGYGVMLAYNHDIGMMDFSAFGRTMHPEFAAQVVFSPAYDEIIETIWVENCGNVAWRLTNLFEQSDLETNPKLALREMLALAVGHSKSKVPITVLNNVAMLRQTMLTCLATDLHHLYHEQRVYKAKNKLDQAELPKQPLDRLKQLKGDLQQAEAAQQDFLAKGHPARNRQIDNYYTDLDSQAYRWLTSEQPALYELIHDVTDTVRALRVADALRQRGTTLKTSGGYPIFVDHGSAKAVIALQKGSGESLLLESDDPLSIGEANMASSEITVAGNLRVSFHRGAFLDEESTNLGALSAALVIDDIQKDTIESFWRPEEVDGEIKSSEEIQILIEEVDDNLAFADLILAELKRLNPELGRRGRIVPSLKHISTEERARYLQAQELDWSYVEREKVLVRMAQAGHKVQDVDLQRAFTDVRLTTLRDDEILIEAGAPPGFVYVPMGMGLVSFPLGGYQAQPVPPWTPLGNTRVIRGDAQEATIQAQQDLKLLMIPKEVYLKHWHNTYNVEEFSAAIQRLYIEDEKEGFSYVLKILEQIAMIDADLEDAEISFIQKFVESYGLTYSVDEIKEKLLTGQTSDYVTLRQSTIDYLTLEPTYLQVARLRDLVNLLSGVDDTVASEEQLILTELNSLLDGYLDDENSHTSYTVFIIPQNLEQDQGIRALLPDVSRVEYSWGYAYPCGAFHSKDYADMICERYRNLKLYAVVELRDATS